jgi:2-keto-4-pentenoate hydratase/2-oxohepta-3-ene-1,7-dioic acid hydratase in catechol pathway
MRLMVGQSGGTTAIYGLTGPGAVNLTAADPTFGPDLADLIRSGDEGLSRARRLIGEADQTVTPSSITPALPLRSSGKIICLGLNYVDHAKEGGYEVPDYPALFMRGMTSMVAAEAPIVRPRCSERLDYEVELMVIIGKGGRHIDQASALDHVFGYTAFNDGSIRDYQRKTHQWTPGKNFDSTGAIGPVIVTPDELPAGAAGLRVQTRLNGEIMQDGNTDDMMFKVDRTIAILSEVMTLEPGDMIAMGTPPGVGHARRPPVWMKPGDVVEVEIEGIGILRNPIVDEVEP